MWNYDRVVSHSIHVGFKETSLSAREPQSSSEALEISWQIKYCAPEFHRALGFAGLRPEAGKNVHAGHLTARGHIGVSILLR
jgi:hypothetical protein